MSKSFKTTNGTELLISNIRGKDYLEVKYRLIWFREEHPDWSIQTEIIKYEENTSTVKARIITNDGQVIATAHKTEDKKDFYDHLEKAETGAIGRALALIGYGTQFAPEFDEGDRVVDAPAQRPKSAPNPFKKETKATSNTRPQNEANKAVNQADTLIGKISFDQAQTLKKIGFSKGFSVDQMNSIVKKIASVDRWGDIEQKYFNVVKEYLEKNSPKSNSSQSEKDSSPPLDSSPFPSEDDFVPF